MRSMIVSTVCDQNIYIYKAKMSVCVSVCLSLCLSMHQLLMVDLRAKPMYMESAGLC